MNIYLDNESFSNEIKISLENQKLTNNAVLMYKSIVDNMIKDKNYNSKNTNYLTAIYIPTPIAAPIRIITIAKIQPHAFFFFAGLIFDLLLKALVS